MATYENALIDINSVASRFLLLYKKSTDDLTLYIEHLCMCLSDFTLYDGNIATYAKFTIDLTKKWIDMPTDMLGFIDLVTPINGSNWSFTEKDRMVTTTTTVALVEGRDEDWGEGKVMDQSRTVGYGAKGGWNKFRFRIDWETRRIYVDGDITENVVLYYVSSGIKATGATEVPAFIMPMMHAYLLWKESYWLPNLVRERPARESDYWKEKMKVRNLINSMTYDQWHDLFLGSTTQSPQR